MENKLATTSNDMYIDVKYHDLDENKKKEVENIKQGIDLNNSQFILAYGVTAQSNLSQFANTAIDNIRTKDTGYVGEILTDLMVKVKDADVDNISPVKGLLSKLPFVNTIARVKSRYEKLNVKIEKITNELDKAGTNLTRDIKMFDVMYEKNIEYIKSLELLIIAGELRLKEIKEKDLPELQEKAKQSNDPVDAQSVSDMDQKIVRFERKLDDLKRTRMISVQNAPQIRIIQASDIALVEKIQSSILNVIPLWKIQIGIALGLAKQKGALGVQRAVTDTFNELLTKNSEMLKQGTMEVQKEVERGIVDIESLKKVNANLISTIDDAIKIQAEGRAKRQQAEQDIMAMEDELKKKLIANK
jgi:uncharacterized protein YaaN involved in tellurite resistance